MFVIIDLQGFSTGKGRFTPKELASYDNFHQVSHYVFAPPFKYSFLPKKYMRQVDWVTDNHHCINWTAGFVARREFANIVDYLTRNVDSVFVKGREKAEYLRRFTNKEVIELEEKPALKKGHPSCCFHTSDECMCALSNVHYLYDFVRKDVG